MAITKAEGVTPTEKLLSRLAERTFLKLWSYPNPFRDDGKELCDLIAVFDGHVLIFFDRESRKFDKASKDILVTWERWKREAIDRQIRTARGAERYIRRGGPIFLDPNGEIPFPIEIAQDARIHKFVVAHGAKEACGAFSPNNLYGSLAVSYGVAPGGLPFPFFVSLDKDDPVHLLDSHNVEILFRELDTFQDFVSFIEEKERVIQRYDHLVYCGEEDLLAHYFLNYDEAQNAYRIGPHDSDINAVLIGEGEWKDFISMDVYARRNSANEVSYLWDEIIQRTSQNALDGTLLGEANLLTGNSAIHEMAREPRFSRRALSEGIVRAIEDFPENDQPLMRNLSFMPSFYPEKSYVFLQLKRLQTIDYDNEYRPVRAEMLRIACGSAKNKFPYLKTVIGIAIDAPKYAEGNSEDFVLLDCAEWTDEQRRHFEEANGELGFFKTGRVREMRVRDFPDAVGARGVLEGPRRKRKTGRNEPCPCGSGRKYKKCCLRA
jgi:hypothetical protein